MSVLPSVTNQNLLAPYFVLLGNLSTSVNPVAAISTMRSDQIVLDGQTLDCTSANGGTLLVNGVALANVNQNVSSINNWAQFPALSSITYSGGGGTGGLINMATGTFSTINGRTNNLSTLVVSGTTSATGLVTTVNQTNTGLLSTLALNASTLNGQRINFYSGQNVLASSYSAINDTTQNISVSTLDDGLYIFYAAGDTTVGKEFVFPFQVSAGTAFAGSTVFNIGPGYNSSTDYGPQNSFSCKGNAATTSKTIGIYYKSTVNPTETINYTIEKIGNAYV